MSTPVGAPMRGLNRLHRLPLRVRQAYAQLASRPQPSVKGLLVVLLILAAMVASLHAWTAMTLSEARAGRDALAQDAQRLEQELAARKTRRDFVEKLPTAVDAARDGATITAAIHHQALAHDVSLIALSTSHEPPSAKSLEHLAWTMSLRGTYPRIKAALAELLDATPNLRILTLKFHRLSAQDIEAEVTLVQWLAPTGVATVPTTAERRSP